jgi:predicted NAD/FAD-binding protein
MNKMSPKRQRIAVIGAGISGLACAYFLNPAHDVILFEAGDYLGGHTNTVDVTLDGCAHPVDTGFLVYNCATYANLIALFAELNVSSDETDMSFGVSMDDGAMEWAGTNLDTVFAQRRNLFSPSFLLMLRDIIRFNKAAQHYLNRTRISGESLGELLAAEHFGTTFQQSYLLPMAAAIWSSSPEDILQYPASTFIQFCLNHSLLQINDRPKWKTVQGGGREYVKKIAATLKDYRINTPVQKVVRAADGVLVTTTTGVELVDSVVFATHAPQTLTMLADADETERTILSAVHYQTNKAILHTDIKQMPQRKKVWSAWNYIGSKTQDGKRPVCVSYLLNKLQNLPFKTPVMVTLNPFNSPDPSSVIAQFDYEHPVFDRPAIEAQRQLNSIQGKKNVWFAGAWTGYGFHEDGLKSALRVADAFGVLPEWAAL